MSAEMKDTAANAASPSLSVTKVRLAFECPRLMYLGHHEGGITLFRASKAQASGVGKAFHTLCDTCINQISVDEAIAALLRSDPERLSPSELAQQIQQQLYRAVFFPYLNSSEQRGQTASLLPLWQGLTGLVQRWAELLVSNRRFCDPHEVIHKTFLAQELPVDHTFDLPSGDRQLVRGRFDSLVYDFAQQRLCVVEYKTYQASDPAAQLAQVALYSYMLQQKLGVTINSAVYSVLPDWQGVEYPWDLLVETLHRLIPPKLQQIQRWLAWRPPHADPPPKTAQAALCDICPQRTKCQSYFDEGLATSEKASQRDEAGVSIPIPPLVTGAIAANFTLDYTRPLNVDTLSVASLQVTHLQIEAASSPISQAPSSTKALPSQTASAAKPIAARGQERSPDLPMDAMASQLVEVLTAFNVSVDYVGAALGPAFVRVKLKPHLGVQVSKVLKFADDLRVHLGLTYPPLIAPQAGYISVDLPRPDRQSAFFEQYLSIPQPAANKNSAIARMAIGVDLEGQLIEADLSDPNTCHFLVGGTTGSGKSEFLRSLLLSLMVRYDPAYFRVALVDPKRVTFPEFETIPWLYEPVVKSQEGAIALMDRLVEEMDERYRRFEGSQTNSLASYNQWAAQASQVPLPRILCIFDEYADFMADKETAKLLEQSIQRLGAMARAAGIHLVISTQRPEAKVVTPLIRSNLPGRVALRTASEADSMIILGGKETRAANLLGKGDLFYSGGGHLQRLQSLFAKATTIAHLVR